MDLRVTVDSKPLLRQLDALYHRQMPFAMSVSLNRTAERARAVQVAGLFKRFDIRRPTRARSSVHIAFSRKTDMRAVLTVRDLWLVQHEAGAVRRPGDLYRSLVHPVGPTERSKGVIRGANTPAALLKSKQGFALRSRSGKPIFLRRTGRKGRRNVAVAFILETAVPIAPRLEFQPTVQSVAGRYWASDFAVAFKEALATASR